MVPRKPRLFWLRNWEMPTRSSLLPVANIVTSERGGWGVFLLAAFLAAGKKANNKRKEQHTLSFWGLVVYFLLKD